MGKPLKTQTTKKRAAGRPPPKQPLHGQPLHGQPLHGRARLEAEGRETAGREANRGAGAGKALVGRVLSAFALLFCVPVGVLFVSVATPAVGVFLGVVGYALGSRGLGRLAVVACTVAMFLGLLVGQGAIPGSYDAMLDGVKESIQDPIPNE